MPISESAIGREGGFKLRVEEPQTAHVYGNRGLYALASPALIGLLEEAAMDAIDGLLAAGERSVGSVVDMEHLAPTPLGARIEVKARVESVEGPKIWFTILATDDSGQIATGRHARFVVDDERFQRRLQRAGTGRQSSAPHERQRGENP
jgi:predicted thioesterase